MAALSGKIPTTSVCRLSRRSADTPCTIWVFCDSSRLGGRRGVVRLLGRDCGWVLTMRQFVIAALMLIGGGVLTLVAASVVEQWALSRHVPHQNAQRIVEADAIPFVTRRSTGPDCGGATFRLGSSFPVKRQMESQMR